MMVKRRQPEQLMDESMGINYGDGHSRLMSCSIVTIMIIDPSLQMHQKENNTNTHWMMHTRMTHRHQETCRDTIF